MSRRQISPILVFLGVLLLVFLVVAPLRALTRTEDAADPSPRATLSDRATASPAPGVNTSRSSSLRSTGRSTSSRGGIWDSLDRAAERRERAERDTERSQTRSTLLGGSTDRARSSGGRTTPSSERADESESDEAAPRRVADAVDGLMTILGADSRR